MASFDRIRAGDLRGRNRQRQGEFRACLFRRLAAWGDSARCVDAGAIVARTVIRWLTAATLVAFAAHAQADSMSGAVGAILAAGSTFAPVGPSWRQEGDGQTGLRLSMTLDEARYADPAAIARTAGILRSLSIPGQVPDPRLRASGVIQVPLSGPMMKQILPGGDMNRDGIISAGRIIVREGAVFLESGDDKAEPRVSKP